MIASLLLGLSFFAQAPDASNGLRLIPSPQQVDDQRGTFQFDASVGIFVADGTKTDDVFAANDVKEEVNSDLGWTPKVFTKNKGKRIMLGVIGRDAAIDAELKAKNLRLPGSPPVGAYILSVQRDKVVIAGTGPEGVFYGAQTLKQLVRANCQDAQIPCCDIFDWPAMKYRGWQDDISRGPIPTLDYLEREVRTLAAFKLNTFTMYTEHVFKLDKHPTIAPPDGITAEEVSELCEYAKQYHVEVIGNFQSFGHFANILKVPGYENLGEGGWILSPAKEESYKFLADVYSEIAPAYESPLFDINCDEVFGLGEGASKDLVAQLGIAGVYAQHINKIADLLKPYNKTPMMWGDIALAYPDIVPKLPKNLIVLSWGYDPRDSFEDAIKPFTALGLQFMVCPGTSTWGQVFPDYDAAEVNISNYVRDGFKENALGMLNTTWDDTGENFFSTSFLPLAWGGECSWRPVVPGPTEDPNTARETRLTSFNNAFGKDFFGPNASSEVRSMWSLSKLRLNSASGGLGDGYTWEPLESLAAAGIDSMAAQKLTDAALQIASDLGENETKLNHNSDTLDFAIYAANRMHVTGEKALVAKQIWDSLDDTVSRKTALDSLARLTADMRSLKAEYERLWGLENRPWWLDKNMAKYDAMVLSLEGLATRPIVSPFDAIINGSLDVKLGSLTDTAKIYYTLDGSTPTAKSTLYSRPITLTQATTLKTVAVIPGEQTSPVTSIEFRALKAPAQFATTMQPLAGHGPESAFDSDPNSYFWSNDQAKFGDTFTVNLNSPMRASHVRVVTGVPDHASDGVHVGSVEVSSDGTTFESVAQFKNQIADGTFSERLVKAVRIKVEKDNGNWLAIPDISLG